MCDKRKLEMKFIFKQIRNRTLKISMQFWSQRSGRRSDGISYKLLSQTDHQSNTFNKKSMDIETASHSTHLSDVMDLRLNDIDVSTTYFIC